MTSINLEPIDVIDEESDDETTESKISYHVDPDGETM